mmetsp:Transcript_58262/g.138800  ORF Transcript_58262/g.138800 Transcript_58262/m.138800 type:complete len:514 (+) Transcript_58262:166-1707(+)
MTKMAKISASLILRRSPLLAEFGGIFVLACMQGASASAPETLGLKAIIGEALVMIILVYCTVEASGHFNPAVSMAVAFAKRLPPTAGLLQFLVVQIGGAVVGMLISTYSFEAHWSDSRPPVQDALHRPLPSRWWATFVAQALAAAMMGLVFLSLALPARRHLHEEGSGPSFSASMMRLSVALGVGCLHVSSTIAVNSFDGGSGSSNAAFTIARMLLKQSADWGSAAVVLSLLAEVAGASIAALLFRTTHPEEYDDRYAMEDEVDDADVDENTGAPVATALAREFVGTYWITLTLCLCSSTAPPGHRVWAYSCAVAAVFLALGDRKGGYFNPCFAVAASASGLRSLSASTVSLIVLLQCLAAALAAQLVSGLASEEWRPSLLTSQSPMWMACTAEATCAALHVCIYVASLMLPTNNPSTRRLVAALPTALCVLCSCICSRSSSGGWFNPAITLGVGLSQLKHADTVMRCWQYLLNQLIGSSIAAAYLAAIVKAKEALDGAISIGCSAKPQQCDT